MLLFKQHSSSVSSKSRSSGLSGSGNPSGNCASPASKSSGSGHLVPLSGSSDSPGDQDPLAPQTSSSSLCLLSKHCASPDDEHSGPPGSSLAHSNDPNSSHADHSLSSQESGSSVSFDDQKSVSSGLQPLQGNRSLSDQDASPSQPKHASVSRLSLPDHNKPLPDRGLSSAHHDDSPSFNDGGPSSGSCSASTDHDPSSLSSHCCSSGGDCSTSGSDGRSASSHSSSSTGHRSSAAGKHNSSSTASNNHSPLTNLSCSTSSCSSLST